MAYKRVILDSANVEREEIIKYLADVSGKDAASKFLNSMDREVDLVGQFPTIHAISRIPELADKGYRPVFFRGYVMLYLFEDDTVFIAHVFHQRQDYAHLV